MTNGGNAYCYVGDRPLSRTDPLGLQGEGNLPPSLLNDVDDMRPEDRERYAYILQRIYAKLIELDDANAELACAEEDYQDFMKRYWQYYYILCGCNNGAALDNGGVGSAPFNPPGSVWDALELAKIVIGEFADWAKNQAKPFQTLWELLDREYKARRARRDKARQWVKRVNAELDALEKERDAIRDRAKRRH